MKYLSIPLVAVMLSACATPNSAHHTPHASANTATAHSVQARNKANVLAFYDMAFNQHKVAEATRLYIGTTYLQHNPTVADGGQAFVNAFAPFLKDNPNSKASIKRVAADGDLVWVHVHSTLDDKDLGESVVDIFRLDEQGKIVEHWDVIQAVPDKTVSGRSVF